jgi:hypothetical protein
MKFQLTLWAWILLVTPLLAAEFPVVEGWRIVGEGGTFHPENLWKQINGAADQYLAFGFQNLHISFLSDGEDSVSVNLFDMGSALNAFGIFRAEIPPEQDRERIGAGAYWSLPFQGVLLKGSHYVKVESWGGNLTEAKTRSLLAGIAEELPGSSSLPGELELLPSAGLVPGSQAFTREGYLGLSELKNCVFADYRNKKGQEYQEYQVFLMLPQSGRSLPEIWQGLANRWQPVSLPRRSNSPEVPGTGDSSDESGLALVRDIPYRGPVGLKLCQQAILGVTGPKERASLIQLLALLVPAP